MSELIRPFVPEDQVQVYRLIMSGLGEYFDTIRNDLNPDLDDIWANYMAAGHLFLVAENKGLLIGTGALVFETPAIGRIVRVSVRAESRRKGVGRAIVQRLIDCGRRHNLSRLVVETNNDWHPAIALYRRCGFTEISRDAQSIHMAMEL